MVSLSEEVSNKGADTDLKAFGTLIPDHMLIPITAPAYYPSHFTAKKKQGSGQQRVRWLSPPPLPKA